MYVCLFTAWHGVRKRHVHTMPLYQPTGSQNNWREHWMLYNCLPVVYRGNYCMRMWTKHINILEFFIGLVDEVPSWRVELWVTPKSALRNLIWFMAQLLVHRPPFCSWPRLWKHVCKYATAEEMYLNDSEVWFFCLCLSGLGQGAAAWTMLWNM